VLTSVSGVGKRLAARICLELKEKVAAAGVAAGAALAADPELESPRWSLRCWPWLLRR